MAVLHRADNHAPGFTHQKQGLQTPHDLGDVGHLFLDRHRLSVDDVLVFDQTLPALRTVRMVRFYHENVIFIVKPDRLRYWIRSTAIWDADDTLTELRQQGY